jgi:hypothetical protein
MKLIDKFPNKHRITKQFDKVPADKDKQAMVSVIERVIQLIKEKHS